MVGKISELFSLFIGEKPKKYKTHWHDWSGGWKRINSNLFPEVKLLNKEPTKVKLVIEKCLKNNILVLMINYDKRASKRIAACNKGL